MPKNTTKTKRVKAWAILNDKGKIDTMHQESPLFLIYEKPFSAKYFKVIPVTITYNVKK